MKNPLAGCTVSRTWAFLCNSLLLFFFPFDQKTGCLLGKGKVSKGLGGKQEEFLVPAGLVERSYLEAGFWIEQPAIDSCMLLSTLPSLSFYSSDVLFPTSSLTP